MPWRTNKVKSKLPIIKYLINTLKNALKVRKMQSEVPRFIHKGLGFRMRLTFG